MKYYNLQIKTPKFFIGEEDPITLTKITMPELIEKIKSNLMNLYKMNEFKLNPQIIYNVIHKDTRPANPVLKLLTEITFH
tara:strand:+ start:377 stop:616 length:240 start_codon:yes stop_codon:yes gene_type:complete